MYICCSVYYYKYIIKLIFLFVCVELIYKYLALGLNGCVMFCCIKKTILVAQKTFINIALMKNEKMN